MTPIFTVTNAGEVVAQSYRSCLVTVADDAVVSITPPSLTGGLLYVVTASSDQAWATVYFRASGAHLCRAAGTNETSVALSTTALTGTIGVNGQFTISCNNGVIQFENRLGVSRSFTCSFMTD